MKPTKAEAEQAVRTLLLWIGEKTCRDGLYETPERVIKSYEEFFSGYNNSAKEVLGRVFEEHHELNEPVLIKDINFYSHCEHHMVPIIGKAHIAYYPKDKIVGLSKLARVVDIFAKRLQTQERLTNDISTAIYENLSAKGVAVLIEAEHMCMAMRGVKKQGAKTLTTSFIGCYNDNESSRKEFFTMLKI